jgi:hypothetical protein
LLANKSFFSAWPWRKGIQTTTTTTTKNSSCATNRLIGSVNKPMISK